MKKSAARQEDREQQCVCVCGGGCYFISSTQVIGIFEQRLDASEIKRAFGAIKHIRLREKSGQA